MLLEKMGYDADFLKYQKSQIANNLFCEMTAEKVSSLVSSKQCPIFLEYGEVKIN